MGKLKNWNYFASIGSSFVYFIIAEDQTSIVAFIAILNYLFYIDNKIDKV